jgi:hypothetical protein
MSDFPLSQGFRETSQNRPLMTVPSSRYCTNSDAIAVSCKNAKRVIRTNIHQLIVRFRPVDRSIPLRHNGNLADGILAVVNVPKNIVQYTISNVNVVTYPMGLVGLRRPGKMVTYLRCQTART